MNGLKREVICVFFEPDNDYPSLVHIFGSKKGAQQFISKIPKDKKPLYYMENHEVIDV